MRRVSYKTVPGGGEDGDDDGEWAWPSTLPMAQAFDLELRCVLCKNIFENAVVLKCGHSFCSACIREALTSQSSKENCPRCRAKADVDDIRPNFSLEGAVRCFREIRPVLLASVRRSFVVEKDGGRSSEQGTSVSSERVSSGKKRRLESSLSAAEASTTEGFALDDDGEEEEHDQRRLPMVAYSVLNDRQIRDVCAKTGISNQGNRDALIWRHKTYTTHWNAMLDGYKKPNRGEVNAIVNQLEREHNEAKAKVASLKREKPKMMDFKSLAMTGNVFDLTLVDDPPNDGVDDSSSGGPSTLMVALDNGMINNFAAMAAELREKKRKEKENSKSKMTVKSALSSKSPVAKAPDPEMSAAEKALLREEERAASAMMMTGSSQIFEDSEDANGVKGQSRCGMVLSHFSQQQELTSTKTKSEKNAGVVTILDDEENVETKNLESSSSSSSSSSSTPPVLPSGWIALWSERTSRFFFFNPESGSGQFMVPVKVEVKEPVPSSTTSASKSDIKEPQTRTSQREAPSIQPPPPPPPPPPPAPRRKGSRTTHIQDFVGTSSSSQLVTGAQWACTACTCLNKGRKKTCDACGAARPKT
jgi:hypothetical protein